MELSICTDVLADLSYTDMLDKVKSYGINAVEMTAGGWGARKHCPTAELLADDAKLEAYMAELTKRDMRISALNTSCNPLWPCETGKEYDESMRDCVLLAEKMGVKKIVCMSGLPGGSEHDVTPNWITSSVTMTAYMQPTVDYQWRVTTEWWKEFAAFCRQHGIEKIAIEEFPCMMVHNVESFWHLREAVGDDIIGINLDPSHMIAYGADPIQAARALKGAIYHVHGKDTRIERGMADINGLCEYKDVLDTANRSWNYVAVGCGQDLKWWKEFFSVVRMMGYNGDVSLEMEDFTMSTEAGIETSIDALKQTISR
ncbi:MAG: sugar phosphate isomerase/epimerase [Lachnospiraceae bacterium]|nr:sugar phosphate isomerase/epimerase [Lachnospiraceae bacterium]